MDKPQSNSQQKPESADICLALLSVIATQAPLQLPGGVSLKVKHEPPPLLAVQTSRVPLAVTCAASEAKMASARVNCMVDFRRG